MGKRLKDVADVHYGKRQNEVVDAYGCYPIYGTGGVFGMANRPLFQGPGVVVGRKGTLDNPQFVASDFWVVDTAYAVLPKEETHPKWLYYALSNVNLAGLNEATGVPSLNRDRLYNVPVGDFSFPCQARIAYVLDTIDEAIQKTEAVIAKLKHIRAGMLHDLLTYGLDKDGKLRDPVAHPEQFKDSELGRIPKEWEVVSLGDALSMQAGDFLSSDRIASDGDYPVYGGNGIRGYTSIFNTEGPLALIGRQGALCGNILIASGRFFATEHAVVVRPRTEMDVDWLAAYLTRMDLNRYSESSAQPELSVNKISYRCMIRPPFPEQSLIGSALVGVRLRLEAEQAELHKFQMVKSGLMDDLLSGDVPVPEDLLQEGVPA